MRDTAPAVKPPGRRKRCSWCGKLIPIGRECKRLDAADHVHHFHKSCWRKQCAWLCGKDNP